MYNVHKQCRSDWMERSHLPTLLFIASYTPAAHRGMRDVLPNNEGGVGNCCPCCPCPIPVPIPMPMPMPIPAPQLPIVRYVQAPMANNPIRLPTASITQCCEIIVPLFNPPQAPAVTGK
ncbi:unnamed protein product [Heligmosomoides polygyrus]|uniref:Spore coat protein n=1 Tax=Heligmosomoides polygyrus TaxID=6339 RepID=A0A183FPA9_HELPZ|nr:unnamed protein product [Heligmosomoides polygyrus]